MRLSRSDIVAITRSAAIGTEDKRRWRKVARHAANPVNGGYAFDFRAALLVIDAGMRAAPFVSSAACSDVGLLPWQAVLPWILAARLLEASLRLPSWINDDLRPVPRPQLRGSLRGAAK